MHARACVEVVIVEKGVCMLRHFHGLLVLFSLSFWFSFRSKHSIAFLPAFVHLVFVPLFTYPLPFAHRRLSIHNPPSIHQVMIRGDPVSSGYYMEAGKTKESFDDDGWFHTGKSLPNMLVFMHPVPQGQV